MKRPTYEQIHNALELLIADQQMRGLTSRERDHQPATAKRIAEAEAILKRAGYPVPGKS